MRKEQGIACFNLFSKFLGNLVNASDEDALILIAGDKRKGKSSVAINLAMRNDPNWNLERVVFSTRDYIHVINSRPPIGSYIIFDDAGLGISSKRWWEDQAVIFGMVSQSVGYRRYVTILTVPDMRWIESTSRSLIRYIITMDRKRKGWMNIRRGYASMNLTHPARFYPYVIIREVKNGIRYPPIKLKRAYSPPLPDDVYAAYERRKDQAFNQIYQQFEEDLKPHDKRKWNYNEKSRANLLQGKKKPQQSESHNMDL
jgi:hypothetical protein